MRWPLLLAMTLGMTVLAEGAVLNVPQDVSTIQAAIDKAQPGDTVVVWPGRYLEQIDFKGKAITVRSTDPTDPAVVEATIIDGSGGQSSVVMFNHYEGPDSVLTGLTITGGSGGFMRAEQDGLLYWGAGIVCYGASPTITHNRIIDNHGPLQVAGPSPVVSYGGGIACLASDAVVAFNCIANNSAVAGGGVFAWGDVEVRNNVIYGNSAYVGGGVAMLDGRLINNTIYANWASGMGIEAEGYGGNLYVGGGRVINNIICAARAGGGVFIETEIGDWFGYNDVWGNRPVDYQPVDRQTGQIIQGKDLTGLYGNISQDPVLIAPDAGDMHLDPQSPCIDAGDPSFVPGADQTDIDGDPRLLGMAVDIGADESAGCRPKANAGPDQRFFEPTTIRLDGSASVFCDPCAPRLYRWVQVGGPAVVIADPCQAVIDLDPPGPGRYVFRLTVSDGTYTSRPDEVVVYIGNIAPVCDAGPDLLWQIPSEVVLDGSRSYDPDGDRLTYSWRQISGPQVQLIGADGVSPSFVCLRHGDYVFELVVSDGHAEGMDIVKVTTMNLAITQRSIEPRHANTTGFHYPDVDGQRVVYAFGSGHAFDWDIVIKDLGTGLSQTYKSLGSGRDLDTQPRIHDQTIVWAGGIRYGQPWSSDEPLTLGIFAARLGGQQVYTLRQQSMTSSYSHPAIWGNKVVWLEHKDFNLDLPGPQADRWWWAPYSIAGADITDIERPVYFTVAQDVGYRDPYEIYGYYADFDHVIDISDQIVVWEAMGDIYGADISDLDAIRVFPICTDPGRQYDPAIYGRMVVWTDCRDDAGDIYGADITDPNCPKLICIVKAQGRQWQPAIDGDLVVYVDDADNGRIKVRRLVAGYAPVELRLQENPSGLGPAIWAGTMVWQMGYNGPLQGLVLEAGISVPAGPVENLSTASRHLTIQDAVNMAKDGARIAIAPGLYREEVRIQDKHVLLTSIYPTHWDVVESTVIDGYWAAIHCLGQVGDTVIDGLVLTGGQYGLVCTGASPRISHCQIRDNWSSGVLMSERSSAILDHCQIIGNGWTGIELARQGLVGRGGIMPCFPTISDCLIAGNAGHGISGNWPAIINCTIVDNALEGLACDSVTMVNSIVYYNGRSRPLIPGPTVTVTYSDIQGGCAGLGNIDVEPGFVRSGSWADDSIWIMGDYRLAKGSVCIDAGDPQTVIEPGQTDLSGYQRLFGSRIDMGAYEYRP